jgi:hypothetical protein
MQNLQGFESIEGFVVNGADLRMVQVKNLQIFASNEGMTVQIGQIVAIQKDFSSIHRKLFRQVIEVSIGALSNVLGPGCIMVASAVVWASHFTVTSIKVTALAQGKAVSCVRAQKLLVSGFHQRNNGLSPGVD